jgi:Mlc titration factor MtfA (ptsG expression regulator)
MVSGDAAEVFAAATELFFEGPEVLLKKNPGLYGLLSDFYKLHPARWLKR